MMIWYITDDDQLEVLLSLKGASFEAAEGYVVEFRVHLTPKTPERPHGITYALVFRPVGGSSIIRFDNAHAAERPDGRFVKADKAHDHWHRSERDPGRPYKFTTASTLLGDFWVQVKRVMDEKGIPNDL